MLILKHVKRKEFTIMGRSNFCKIFFHKNAVFMESNLYGDLIYPFLTNTKQVMIDEKL